MLREASQAPPCGVVEVEVPDHYVGCLQCGLESGHQFVNYWHFKGCPVLG